MAIRIRIRRDTSTNWQTNNPVLAEGEIAFETDTRLIKVGDGSSNWNDLDYIDSKTLAGRLVDQFANVNHTHSFIDLTDTPNDYSGHAGKVVTVSQSEDSLTFSDVQFPDNLSDIGKVQVNLNDTADYLSNKLQFQNALESIINDSSSSSTIIINVLYDDSTITVNDSNQLTVKDGSIDSNKLADNIDAQSIGFNADKVDGKDASDFANTILSNVEDNIILNKIKNVDGHGSGLDADTLDKYQASKTPTANVIPVTNNTGKLDNWVTVNVPVSTVFTNRIVNGNFRVWQRGLLHAFSNDGQFVADRMWAQVDNGGLLVANGLVESLQDVDSSDPFGDGSCVSFWKFNNSLTNDVNSSLDLIMHGQTPTYIDGKFDKALTYENVDTTVYANTQSTINCTSWGGLTVSFWIKIYSDDYNQWQCVFRIDEDGQDFSSKSRLPAIFLSKNQSNILHINANTTDSSTPVGIDSSVGQLEVGSWDFVTLVMDLHSMKLYINGTLTDTFTTDKTYYFGNGTIFIGDKWYYQNFAIDEVRLFNRPLTSEEVILLYKNTKIAKQVNNIYTVKVNSTSVDVSGDQVLKPLEYRFEGQHLYDIANGNGKITVAFDFLSSKTGDYSISLINMVDPEHPQSYVTKFTYNSTTNEFQHINVTFDLTTFTQPVSNDNNLSYILVIAGMNTGSKQTTAEGLNDGYYITLSGTVTDFTKDDYMSFRHLQAVAGENDPQFYYGIDQQIEELLCMRYFRISNTAEYVADSVPSMRVYPTITKRDDRTYYFDSELKY